MISQECSNIIEEAQKTYYTAAHTFEKENSLSFRLLFGNFKNKRASSLIDLNFENAIDYFFEPGQIFGFLCESKGQNFQKFYYSFILQACSEREIGNIIPGISPGAKVLVKTLNKITSNKLITVLNNMANEGKNLSQISLENYVYLNKLLNEKIRIDYFVSELNYHEKY